MLTETLNRYVDEWVIRHVFGADEKPLAHVKVLVSPRECTTGDLQIDEFLLRHGAPLSLEETMVRYGRALPKAGEKLFARGASQAQASLPESSQNAGTAHEMENEGYGCGPSVSFRECSPVSTTASHETAPERRVTRVEQDQPNQPPSGELSAACVTDALENQFTILQEEWLQLSPFGDFPHARGLQRVDRAAADTMLAQFNSFRGRLGRLFGGVPVYVGHPDLPGAMNFRDHKAYGWIMELELREDGIYGRVKWSDAGLDLLRNAHFKFYSPYWEAREIGSENGRRIYRPVALISLGLTNQPNIPVRPLANETITSVAADVSPSLEGPEVSIVGDEVTSLPSGAESEPASSLPRFVPEASGDEKRLVTSSPTIGTFGRRPAESETRIGNQWPECAPPPMHTVSCTEHLGRRKSELVRVANRRDRIHECVLGKMRLGLSYDQAWEHVKREHASWFRES